ncbi:MAG TPA: hypothetical protein VFO19_10190 [Vicinamibacterales bacterium]|nr:hypothetical protein [Vicinamibacterales bacterium]
MATLTWFDRDGAAGREVPNSTAAYQDIWLERGDESIVAAIVEDGRAALWRIDLRSGRRVAVTLDVPSNIIDRARRVTSWSADAVVYEVSGADGRPEIWTDPPDGDAVPYLAGPGSQGGRLSAERRWMAYESLENGDVEIYLRTFPDPNAGRWLLAGANARRPVWRIDSSEIYHWSADGALMATPLKRGEAFILPGRSTALFTWTYADDPPPFAVTRDGRRVLVARPESR